MVGSVIRGVWLARSYGQAELGLLYPTYSRLVDYMSIY